MYGRDDEEWDQLADAGLAFLVERAHLETLTSYTELNATLERRTGLPGFDFARADERAAMGHLRYLIVERNRPKTKRMISALVTYLGANDGAPVSMRWLRTSANFLTMPRHRQSWTSGSRKCKSYTSTMRGVPSTVQLEFFPLARVKTAVQDGAPPDSHVLCAARRSGP